MGELFLSEKKLLEILKDVEKDILKMFVLKVGSFKPINSTNDKDNNTDKFVSKNGYTVKVK